MIQPIVTVVLLARIAACIALASATGMAVNVISWFAYWPPRWSISSVDTMLGVAVIGTAYLAAVPLLVLGCIALRRAPSTALSVAVLVAWSLIVFFIRARKPWTYYGEFPTWILVRDFVHPLPVSLAVALAFGLACRLLLPPHAYKS